MASVSNQNSSKSVSLVPATYEDYEKAQSNVVDNQKGECPWCRDKFKEENFKNDGVLRDDYYHFVHRSEYIQWLKIKAECLECRRKVDNKTLEDLEIIPKTDQNDERSNTQAVAASQILRRYDFYRDIRENLLRRESAYQMILQQQRIMDFALSRIEIFRTRVQNIENRFFNTELFYQTMEAIHSIAVVITLKILSAVALFKELQTIQQRLTSLNAQLQDSARMAISAIPSQEPNQDNALEQIRQLRERRLSIVNTLSNESPIVRITALRMLENARI